jgi:hypothetical protein
VTRTELDESGNGRLILYLGKDDAMIQHLNNKKNINGTVVRGKVHADINI